MREIRILHTADVHLDCLLGHLPYDRRVIRRAEVAGGLRRLVESGREHRVDAMLVVGDLFDGRHLSRETVAQTAALFRDAGFPVLVVPGNHDPLDGPRSPYAEGILPPTVHVFGGAEFTPCRMVEGVTVYGLPFLAAARRRRSLRGFAARFPPSPEEGFRVVAHHGAYTGFTVPEGDYAPVLPEDLAATAAHYVALGHHHSFRDCSPPGGPPAFYPGSPVRLDWSDLPERRAILVRFQPGKPAAVEVLPLPDRPQLVLEFDLERSPLEELFTAIEAMADSQALARVVLEGGTGAGGPINPGRVEAACRDRFFHLRVEDRTRLPGPGQSRSTLVRLFLARLDDRLRDPAGDGPGPDILDEAKKYGLAALRGEDHR